MPFREMRNGFFIFKRDSLAGGSGGPVLFRQ
jgi:hypothetical protein